MEGWINVPNYSDKSRQIGNVDLNIPQTQISLVLRIRTIVRGQSQNLLKVYDSLGTLLCTTDEFGWVIIQQVIPEPTKIIGTYTISGKDVIMNDTVYSLIQGNVIRMTPLIVNGITYFQCYSIINTLLFITDESGRKLILSSE